MCLFKHEKQLFHPVEVERPNPQYAALLQEQLGGGNGELKAAMQYMSQSFRIKDPKIKDLFLDIAAEELGHILHSRFQFAVAAAKLLLQQRRILGIGTFDPYRMK